MHNTGIVWATLMMTILVGMPVVTHAYAPSRASGDLHRGKLTCDIPFRLARDCSIWAGATRSIAFGDYRMRLAADDSGRTILVAGLRPGPDHNASRFDRQLSMANAGSCAIRLIGSLLEDRGIHLQRSQQLGRGQRIDGWILEFSDNAYDYLKQFTVLESEYWLPALPN